MNSKQAACLNCRRSKIKCRRDEGAPNCERCTHLGAECVIPEFHIGRQKGVKNKRSGLEKAIFQVEEAIKKRKSDAPSHRSTLEQLQKLLNEAQNDDSTPPAQTPGLNSMNDPFASDSRDMKPPATLQLSERDHAGGSSDDQLAVEDVENPLQLLARASDLRITSPHTLENNISTPGSKINGSEHSAFLDVHQFFLPMKANFDQGPGYDPIDIGLVTKEEAKTLLTYFHQKLAHTRWGLDPMVHTLDFVRYRSSFLFTTLLAFTAVFLPETASLAKRLLIHRRFLAEQVIVKKFRSVEIVLAFMVSIPWMPPGQHATDDDTSLYLATALSIALDLSLDKVITPSSTFNADLIRQVPRGECLDAGKALAMDGLEDVDADSAWGKRLLRRRERTWIALFVLERGVCLARGRSYCVPKTPLIQHCDYWPSSLDSDLQDGPLVSMAALRRDLDDLFANVRARCDSYRVIDVGLKVAHEIERAIDEFFDKWLHTWTSVIGDFEHKTLPPYVEILVTHTRLSTYSMLLNHPSAPPEVKRSFRASAVSSALNVMRAAIQGESRLKSMPNNTVTMICFAASIALALSAPTSRKRSNQNLAPSVRKLIQETATVLERIGSTPSHRNGASVVYGRFLRVLVKQAPSLEAASAMASQPYALPVSQHNLGLSPPLADGTQQFPSLESISGFGDPLPFSAMSYNEVNEAVTNLDFFTTPQLDIWNDENSYMWNDMMNLPDFNFP
ncbi:hypothetical protein BU25DRAFT_373096 [Macroventuria anomochaeta]|uniref:Uncharacterized protein n=1 Tax=Macroventuria anomochaeta TaxID=301207 RepID=A0ACB6RV04_9PLEO|nr:uncharacterized protein BU25DRAFT_373096 [Macroventuria anomochaeta]KAF2624908.1 hypothetical protein BU25DRAFT_373096 [Macroventuria anomochaeta]